MSYKADVNAYAVDAFSLKWNEFQSYVFPLLICIWQCFQLIRMEKTEGIQLETHWTTQPVYSKIMKMEKGIPTIIPASVASLVHPNKEKLKSVVAEKTDHVSGVAVYRTT